MCKTKAADRKAQSTQMRMPSSQAEMSFILFSNTVGKKLWLYIINNFEKSEIRTLKVTEKKLKILSDSLSGQKSKGRTNKKTDLQKPARKRPQGHSGPLFFLFLHSQQLHFCTYTDFSLKFFFEEDKSLWIKKCKLLTVTS